MAASSDLSFSEAYFTVSVDALDVVVAAVEATAAAENRGQNVHDMNHPLTQTPTRTLGETMKKRDDKDRERMTKRDDEEIETIMIKLRESGNKHRMITTGKWHRMSTTGKRHRMSMTVKISTIISPITRGSEDRHSMIEVNTMCELISMLMNRKLVSNETR